MTAVQLFNEVLFIVTFLVMIAAMAILATVALLRYRRDTDAYDTLARRVTALELAEKPAPSL